MYAQMSFTSVNDKPVPLSGSAPARDEMKAESFNFGAYLSDRLGPVSYEVNAATGSVKFDSSRLVSFNGVADILTGAWDGTSTAAAARLDWPVLQDDHLLRVEAGVDHFKLEQDGFSENTSLITDPGLRLQLGSGISDVTSHFIGLRGRLSRGGGHPAAVVFEPNYYLGFRSIADYTPYSARANFVGDSTQFDLTAPDEMQDSTEIGLGIAAHNDYFAFEFTYRGSFADDAETHGGGVSIRLLV